MMENRHALRSFVDPESPTITDYELAEVNISFADGFGFCVFTDDFEYAGNFIFTKKFSRQR